MWRWEVLGLIDGHPLQGVNIRTRIDLIGPYRTKHGAKPGTTTLQNWIFISKFNMIINFNLVWYNLHHFLIRWFGHKLRGHKFVRMHHVLSLTSHAFETRCVWASINIFFEFFYFLPWVFVFTAARREVWWNWEWGGRAVQMFWCSSVV